MSKILILILVPAYAYAGTGQFNYELNLLAGYDGGNDVYTTPGQRPGIGFEYYKVFSGEYGDGAAIDVQFRSTADPDGRYESPYVLTPFYGNDNEPVPAVWLELHNAYIHFKINRGRSDVWFGHRDVPFGLERSLDTHGTILQSFAMDVVGFKKDWGAGVVGRFDKWDYSVVGALGSGMPFSARGNWSAGGRIGILDPNQSDVSFGVSCYYANALPTTGLVIASTEPVERFLGGADLTGRYGRLSFLAEGVYGKVEERNAAGGWARVTAGFPDYRWLAISGQGSVFYDDVSAGKRTYRAGAEATVKYNAAVTIGGAYLLADDGESRDHRFLVHLYYFYPKLTNWLPT